MACGWRRRGVGQHDISRAHELSGADHHQELSGRVPARLWLEGPGRLWTPVTAEHHRTSADTGRPTSTVVGTLIFTPVEIRWPETLRAYSRDKFVGVTFYDILPGRLYRGRHLRWNRAPPSWETPHTIAKKYLPPRGNRLLCVLFATAVSLSLYSSMIATVKVKAKEAYLYSAYYELLVSRGSGMALINEGSHSFTCHLCTYTQKLNEPYLPLTPSRRASPHLAGTNCLYRWGRRLSWPGWLGEIVLYCIV